VRRARVSEPEREQLNRLFAELCAIPSPFGAERACADRVLAELDALGLEAAEDSTAGATGAGAGNLLARIPGSGPRWLLLCAHLDTVPVGGPIEPVLVDDGWENAADTILGADNKAAVAVLLQAARRWVAEAPTVGIELLFTVSEEDALAGAKAFDAAQLRSEYGYVFDHASPIGEIVVASPTYYRIEADFRGVAAHAGIRPQDGRSAIAAAARGVCAMRLGRLDEETTANVGTIGGGDGSTNVVPERCRLLAEARSLDRAKVEATVAEMVDRCYDAANVADCQCDVDVTVERRFDGYRDRGDEPHIAVAERALRACGYEPTQIGTGGGSDANAFVAAGLPCANLANGTQRNHQPDERVSVAALEGMLDVALALPEAAINEPPGSEPPGAAASGET
jgi:tripeptide aminopeptidase